MKHKKLNEKDNNQSCNLYQPNVSCLVISFVWNDLKTSPSILSIELEPPTAKNDLCQRTIFRYASNSCLCQYWTNEELKAYLKMVRWFHNFMAVGRSNTVFELLGNTQEMFHGRIMEKYKQTGWYDLRN
jgi:hypothetical protein